jgi:hypothetical protein
MLDMVEYINNNMILGVAKNGVYHGIPPMLLFKKEHSMINQLI